MSYPKTEKRDTEQRFEKTGRKRDTVQRLEESGSERCSCQSCARFRLRGSYTIEAACVIPMIGLLIVCMLLTSFLFYDKAMLETRARSYLQSEERVLPPVDDLFFLSGVTFEADQHEVSYEAALRFPGGYQIILSDTVREVVPVSLGRVRVLKSVLGKGGEIAVEIWNEFNS